MKSFLRGMTIFCALAVIIGCGGSTSVSSEDAPKNSLPAPSGSVAGIWAASMSDGVVLFNLSQSGNEITGTFGEYTGWTGPIRGVIAGSQVELVCSYNDGTSYAIIATLGSNGIMTGTAGTEKVAWTAYIGNFDALSTPSTDVTGEWQFDDGIAVYFVQMGNAVVGSWTAPSDGSFYTFSGTISGSRINLNLAEVGVPDFSGELDVTINGIIMYVSGTYSTGKSTEYTLTKSS